MLKNYIGEMLASVLFVITFLLTIYYDIKYYPFLILSMGYLFTYIAYVYFDLKMGGVIVLPLLVLYVLKDPLFLALFIGSALICYVAIKLIKRYALIYGRRLFLSSLTVSLCIAMISSIFNGIGCLLIPGIFSYNLERDMKPAKSIYSFVVGFILLYLVGILLVGI